MASARKKQKLDKGGSVVTETEVGQETAQDAEQQDVDTKEQPHQSRSLFVRGLPSTTTSESLTEFFSESFPIKHAVAVTDNNTQQCRGYGFVTFADADDAQRAKAEFHGQALDGRKLRIEVAEARHRESGKEAAHGDSVKTPSAKRRQSAPQASRLIVRNLPWSIKTSDQLSKLFRSYGKVKQAYLPKKGPGLLAGFGFVVLQGQKTAEKALEGVNGTEVDGRTIAVDWALNKEVYDKMGREDGGGSDDEEQDSGELGASDNESDDEGVRLDAGDSGSEDESAFGSTVDDDGTAEDDADVDVRVDGQTVGGADASEDRSATIFVRNLPFTCTDENLEDHFSTFGNTRYARVVLDFATGRSKGTGFVCFREKAHADDCIRGAPPQQHLSNPAQAPHLARPIVSATSVLQNDDSDPTGRYTMDGRVLQVSRAVNKSEAQRLFEQGAAHRHKRDEDKRRLFLLSEGTISSQSPLWATLAPSERTMREASAKQRKTLIESNPLLHLSLTRLSVRNIPRTIGSKELKALAREAVVGFATDVKAGKREPISKEELSRGGEEMHAAERARKKAGKGVVKQTKVVFEGAGGSKVSEETGAGRSRGYGFIEYYTHRNALMGLRWLNGHSIDYHVANDQKRPAGKQDTSERKKRLVVEFAIENAQVVIRRKGKEQKARERSEAVKNGVAQVEDGSGAKASGADSEATRSHRGKRKRDSSTAARGDGRKGRRTFEKPDRSRASEPVAKRAKPEAEKAKLETAAADGKLAKRNQIIGRKRAMRKARQGAK